MAPRKSRPAETPNATRQMLDELDALMEQMLALPVNDLDAPVPAPPPPVAPARPAATLTETAPSLFPEEQGQGEGEFETASETEEPPRPKTGKILVGRFTPAEPAYQAPEEDETAPGSSTLDSLPSYRTTVEEDDLLPAHGPPAPSAWDRSEPLPAPDEILPPLIRHRPNPDLEAYRKKRSWGNWLFQPLLWINQAYDRATPWLGPLGRWLRSPGGRSVLGYTGLTLLALAIAWSLRDWLGTW